MVTYSSIMALFQNADKYFEFKPSAREGVSLSYHMFMGGTLIVLDVMEDSKPPTKTRIHRNVLRYTLSLPCFRFPDRSIKLFGNRLVVEPPKPTSRR